METFTTYSEEETVALARRVGASARPGAVILLYGQLGAGKTAFVRGMAEGLGVQGEHVSSPTFTLVHEYRGGRLPLHHADLYRLGGTAADDLGLEELGAADGVLVIEWPERLVRALPGATEIRIEIVDDTTRRITLQVAPPVAEVAPAG